MADNGAAAPPAKKPKIDTAALKAKLAERTAGLKAKLAESAKRDKAAEGVQHSLACLSCTL